MKNYLASTMKILNEAVDSVDIECMEMLINDCEKVLKRGNKVICSGLGKNVPVCEKFVGTMNSFGFDACFMNTNSAAHGDIGMVKDGDLVVVLTKSGETIESVFLHSMLEERNCIEWLITFERESLLSEKIEKSLIIKLNDEGDKWNIVPNNSTTLNLIILQTVAMQLSERMDISLARFKKNHPGGHIGEILKDKMV